MSLYHMAFARLSLLACISAATLQNTYADTTSFESALSKVQTYQKQNQAWQQYQQLADLNIKQSKLRPNPSIAIEQSGFKSDQDRELSIGIRQPLDIFGQRKINQSLANTSAQQIQLQQQLFNSQSQLIVQYIWSQLSIAQSELSIYAAQLQLSKANLESVQKRYQAGSLALVDVERAQVEALETQRLYQQAELNQHVAARQLTNLWGESLSLFDLNQITAVWPDQSEKNVRQNLAEGWLEKLYALNIQQSHQQIESLKVQARPNPTLNVGMKRTKTANENNDTSLILGVDVPLNIFNRQQYTIPIAQQQQMLLNQQQQRELKQQILDIANNFQQLKGLRGQFNASVDQITLAEKVQNRMLQGFRAGKFAITDLQQTTLQLQNLRLSQLQILRQAWKSAITAEALSLGTSYEEISRSDAYSQLNKTALTTIENLIKTPSGR